MFNSGQREIGSELTLQLLLRSQSSWCWKRQIRCVTVGLEVAGAVAHVVLLAARASAAADALFLFGFDRESHLVIEQGWDLIGPAAEGIIRLKKYSFGVIGGITES